MGLGDNLVSTAVTEAFEQSGLEPGELNNKIDSVMDTMEQANTQLDDADQFQEKIRGDIQHLDETAKTLADASATLAEAAVGISESADKMSTSIDQNSNEMEELQDEVQELNEALSKVQEFVEEHAE